MTREPVRPVVPPRPGRRGRAGRGLPKARARRGERRTRRRAAAPLDLSTAQFGNAEPVEPVESLVVPWSRLARLAEYLVSQWILEAPAEGLGEVADQESK